ncbi:keratin-associated protein 16-1-like [Nilaparvata lugens]|uniref:keratin-associated protein 16-1-like n=1 Tax=Nilaparvata lugens TaxID=108931 RepID=UPI00193E936D|nr:keratin-associated protein 16-1-like [Nilaparvata lugens]
MCVLHVWCTECPVMPPVDPCVPTPCGPNSQCQALGDQAACSCLPKYVGTPPNCRPECSISAECPNNLACLNEQCKNPCPGSCGPQALCSAVNHKPVCSCPAGLTGDPFSTCSPPSKSAVASVEPTL